MKFYSSLSVIMMVTWGVFGTTWANLQFGSRESGFIVSSGATLNLGTATLIDGMIRQSGDISASALTCTSVTIEVKDGTDIKKITTDGTLTPTSNLQLGNNQKLTVAGGSVHEALNITGGSSTPSILEGFGWLASDIKINPASQLNLRWSSPLGVNINFHFTSNDQSSSVALEQDFYLAFGSGFYATYATGGLTNVIGILSFDRGSLFIGGESTSYASVAGNMQWVMPSVILTGPLSIDEATTVALSSGGHINGYGYTLNFTDETSVLAIDDDSTICLVDIILTGLTSTSLANTYVAADGVWFCTNTTDRKSVV